jgi:translation initiation factor IF-1
MVSIPKVVRVLSCGFVLCLGLSHAAQADNAASAADELKADQTDRRQGGQEAGEQQMNDKMEGSDSKGGKAITGEVLRVEGNDNYFVKGQDGKEVRLHTDKTTQMLGEIKKGDRIEAKVNDQNHLLSIRSARGTDAGNGKEEGRDSLGEVKN